ncbi:MAG: glutamyl-tRNA reductase, partial [bacterium]
MKALQVIGMNHRTAPVDVREKLAFSPEETRAFLKELHKRDDVTEAVLLSTCNRTELYYFAQNPPEQIADKLYDSLLDFHEVNELDLDQYGYHYNGLRAVKHCFQVAGSLNSMVVGESQILGQVKQAYRIARDEDLCGKFLHQLFQ